MRLFLRCFILFVAILMPSVDAGMGGMRFSEAVADSPRRSKAQQEKVQKQTSQRQLRPSFNRVTRQVATTKRANSIRHSRSNYQAFNKRSLFYNNSSRSKINQFNTSANRKFNRQNGKISSSLNSWSSKKGLNSVKNAEQHFKDHGAEFNAKNPSHYVNMATKFTSRPPKGTLIKKRKNGDTVYYHPKLNTFAVAGKDGRPRTMFKPNTRVHGYSSNMLYYNAQ